MNKTHLFIGLGMAILAVSAVTVVYAASNNYGAWREAMGSKGGRASEVVTEKNFDQFNKMHQLMVDGEYGEAQKIRTELGLGQGRGNRSGGCGMNNGAGHTGGGCAMHKGAGDSVGFADTNNNGVCDHAEQLVK
ncbi:hypothetical protein L6270_04925 [Candidatus Parcubacteria bacterium]|nr:hypothetical protein [Patescibacteria group bacterium]MBU4577665.1 hypothetical protein [Patescibacteria group bacterium]MCG2697351.1 hypothetical protein [Candidatus Parcubacteria bacterium]